MRSVGIILVLLISLSGVSLFAQSNLSVVKDLRQEWLVVDGEGYKKFEKDAVKKIFFTLDVSKFKGNFLCIEDDRPFAVFVDQKLLLEKKSGLVKLNMDSLGAQYSSLLTINIFQPNRIASLATYVAGPAPPPEAFDQARFPRKGDFFLDFSLLATLLVSIYLIMLLRTNPRLTFDYLNVYKLFSAMEREENVLSGRITSRVNLLFYSFCCLFCALTLLVVFHLSKNVIPVATMFPVRSTAEGFLQWIKLSLIIAVLLAFKLVIVFVFSILFDLRDTAYIQFFNFIRTLNVAAGLIALVSTTNFVLHGQYGGLDSLWLKLGAVVMVISAVMMFLKLLALARYHFFHLFSYLCASEIIPLVILLKILLY